MKPEHKKKVESAVKKMEEGMGKLDATLKEKVSPKVKGLELPIFHALVAMVFLGGLSSQGIFVGVLVLVVTGSPVIVPKVMKILDKKSAKPKSVSKKKTEPKAEPTKEEDSK